MVSIDYRNLINISVHIPLDFYFSIAEYVDKYVIFRLII